MTPGDVFALYLVFGGGLVVWQSSIYAKTTGLAAGWKGEQCP